ncbi:UDP-N-acetylenolpyruvoylglucosamine reductase [Gammaproteobacteria bacterium 42_54_T18]|nr:UDP-N-acetylenolpyruvoylglucosamine reductase [Gammaproteobacteria bacterium 42_54_T18]
MFQKQFCLVDHNTLASKALAAYFYAFSSEEQLHGVLAARPPGVNCLVLGSGSNVVFASDVDALVLHNVIQSIEVVDQTEESVLVQVAGGVLWHSLVLWSIEEGYSGLENLSLIPGTVGAAPIQNIGAYGVELCDVFESLDAIEIETGRRISLNKAQCGFAYRHSIFKTPAYIGQWVVVSVTLKLRSPKGGGGFDFKTEYGEIEAELARRNVARLTPKLMSDVIISIRQRKLPDPNVLPNVGSFFKNPIVTTDECNRIKNKFPALVHYPLGGGKSKLAAGWMIDQLGWKGREEGGAKVHDQQALVLTNVGGGGKAVVDLSKKIQVDVFDVYGVFLEPEPLIFV